MAAESDGRAGMVLDCGMRPHPRPTHRAVYARLSSCDTATGATARQKQYEKAASDNEAQDSEEKEMNSVELTLDDYSDMDKALECCEKSPFCCSECPYDGKGCTGVLADRFLEFYYSIKERNK